MASRAQAMGPEYYGYQMLHTKSFLPQPYAGLPRGSALTLAQNKDIDWWASV